MPMRAGIAARGRFLLPYRIHRAGSTGEAVAAAQQDVGTSGNPVTGLAITVGGKLEVIFADGATVELDLPAGMGGGVLDQTARDSAADAQATADGATTAAAAAQADLDAHEANHPSGGGGTDQMARAAAAAAQADLDAHEASPHNTDAGARTAASAAQGTADAAQADLDTHERAPHNHDATARAAAAAAQAAADAAQTDLDTHEASPHNTDAGARTAASAAQARADDAYTLADGKVDSSGAAAGGAGASQRIGGRPKTPIRSRRRNSSTSSMRTRILSTFWTGACPACRSPCGWAGRRGRNLHRGGFRPAVAAHRRQHFRHERWPCRAAVPARSRFGPDAFSWESGWPAIPTLWRLAAAVRSLATRDR